jgi:DNA polymerase-3 subunit delta'
LGEHCRTGNLKKLLRDSIAENRVSHAQLFVGKEGYGTLPMVLAYAKEILSRENEHAASKVEHFNHLDLHFSFPVFTDNKNSLSKNKFEEFREMILNSPYSSYDDWTAFLESENKQLFISADEIDDQNQKFSLKVLKAEPKF